MKKTIRLTIVLFAIGLFLGCSGDTNSPSVVKREANIELNTTALDLSTGGITKDTEIKVANTGITMVISEGTVLQDIDGNSITKAPTVGVKSEKGNIEAKTTLNFEVDGKKVIPTEPVLLSLPAPSGSKAGDIVQIEAPDDGSITQKLIFLVVKADGTVDIRIFPRVFKRGLIIIIVFLKTDTSTN